MDAFLPDEVNLKGDCDEDESSLSMSFKGFVLGINFKKVGDLKIDLDFQVSCS